MKRLLLIPGFIVIGFLMQLNADHLPIIERDYTSVVENGDE
ncbi:hypothetical protein [Salibacterium salarium]|nr:hypothetical protein [Salibacterium salarium]